MEDQLDYAAVQRYWDNAASTAAAASYMAHEQGLPQSCVDHRFAREKAVVEPWFRHLPSTAAMLDVGCGGGAWTALFAQRYRRVVGVDVSPSMLAAAARRLAGLDNVELLEGDARQVRLEGPLDAAFVGGVLMYMNREDAVRLLNRLRELIPAGPIVLRESTVRRGVEVKTHSYHVAYRSPTEYTAIAADAGLRVKAIQINHGYGDMQIAAELVDLARRIPAIANRDPAVVGRPLWRTLHLTAPISLQLLPRVINAIGIEWPHLTNHFLLLQRN